MAIQNLEQQRLIFAMEQGIKNKGKGNYDSLVKKIPAYIQTNGFLYTLAFLDSKRDINKQGIKNDAELVFEDIWEWHCNTDQNDHKMMLGVTLPKFMEELFKKSDAEVRFLTLETLSLFKCLKRFVKDE
jgi:CRISPR type III-B/RAMP module-associated protein Cmr5